MNKMAKWKREKLKPFETITFYYSSQNKIEYCTKCIMIL